MVQSDTVKVVAELPGVEKSDIALECDGRNLVLKVDTDKMRYYKSLELPVEEDPHTSTASYKNVVLKRLLTAKSRRSKQKKIRIDPFTLTASTRILHTSGFSHISTERPLAAVIPNEKPPFFMAPHLEYDHVREECPLADEVVTYPDYPGKIHPMRIFARYMAQ